MDNIVQFLKMMSDKNRIRIVVLLEQRPMCVCELAYILGVTQPSVSRHLKKMKTVNLIGDVKDGLWTNYFLIKDSDFFKKIRPCLKYWLRDEPIVKADLEKMKTVERTKICCSK